MHPVPIHTWPFIVAVLIKFIVGWLWYSPMLFLRQWQTLSGITDEQMKGGMAKGIAIWLIGSVLMTFILAHAVYYAGANTVVTGAEVGFANWVGFVLVVALDTYAAEKRPFQLVAINTGSNLIALILMGGVLGGWQS
jgi:hypothetical protein